MALKRYVFLDPELTVREVFCDFEGKGKPIGTDGICACVGHLRDCSPVLAIHSGTPKLGLLCYVAPSWHGKAEVICNYISDERASLYRIFLGKHYIKTICSTSKDNLKYLYGSGYGDFWWGCGDDKAVENGYTDYSNINRKRLMILTDRLDTSSAEMAHERIKEAYGDDERLCEAHLQYGDSRFSIMQAPVLHSEDDGKITYTAIPIRVQDLPIEKDDRFYEECGGLPRNYYTAQHVVEENTLRESSKLRALVEHIKELPELNTNRKMWADNIQQFFDNLTVDNTHAFTLTDLETNPELLMKVMELGVDYKKWFFANFPDDAASKEEVRKRIADDVDTKTFHAKEFEKRCEYINDSNESGSKWAGQLDTVGIPDSVIRFLEAQGIEGYKYHYKFVSTVLNNGCCYEGGWDSLTNMLESSSFMQALSKSIEDCEKTERSGSIWQVCERGYERICAVLDYMKVSGNKKDIARIIFNHASRDDYGTVTFTKDDVDIAKTISKAAESSIPSFLRWELEDYGLQSYVEMAKMLQSILFRVEPSLSLKDKMKYENLMPAFDSIREETGWHPQSFKSAQKAMIIGELERQLLTLEESRKNHYVERVRSYDSSDFETSDLPSYVHSQFLKVGIFDENMKKHVIKIITEMHTNLPAKVVLRTAEFKSKMCNYIWDGKYKDA